ncbi:MAG: plasmid mobilization relaxosome protein MobC [Lachnospiraceae bacterium]|nr:plasmid mobilization relaxosome protein MobC [Lachnospiraceae bacterium]
MSQKRPIAKRYDLNEYEAKLLKEKARQAGMKEGQLVRELITGYAPTEKPGKDFFDAMNDINKIGININQIAAVANSTGYIDDKFLRQCVEELNKKMLDIKNIVLKAKPYPINYYEKLLIEQKRARAEGRPEPKYGDDLFPDD